MKQKAKILTIVLVVSLQVKAALIEKESKEHNFELLNESNKAIPFSLSEKVSVDPASDVNRYYASKTILKILGNGELSAKNGKFSTIVTLDNVLTDPERLPFSLNIGDLGKFWFKPGDYKKLYLRIDADNNTLSPQIYINENGKISSSPSRKLSSPLNFLRTRKIEDNIKLEDIMSDVEVKEFEKTKKEEVQRLERARKEEAKKLEKDKSLYNIMAKMERLDHRGAQWKKGFAQKQNKRNK